jgi:hypothetical protein
LDKENVVYIDKIKYYSDLKNAIMLFAGKWLELEIIVLSERSKSQKEKYSMFSLK